tara:strand:+ start:8629 stop:9216 length:588 start_codon:yes stop_codon:yes gene_type:complete
MNYWGEPDTSVSFCEKKYDKTFWIAEYYNTLSALSYIVLGSFFLATRIKHIGISMIILGLSTMVMHGTLRYYGQWLDEYSMLVISYSAIKLISNNSDKGYFFIFIYYFIFKDYFIPFFIMFACMQIYMIIMTRNVKLSKIQKILINMYIFYFFLGLICWFIDQLFCDKIGNIPFHAAWHVFTALGMFYGFLSFIV